MFDIREFGVEPETYRSLQSFKGEKPKVGVKPMLLFSGDVWERDDGMRKVKYLWMDFFRGEEVKSVDVEGLQYVLSFLAEEVGKFHVRGHMIRTKKSGQKLPRVEVEECGPRLDLVCRRAKEASEEMVKEAFKTPRKQLVCYDFLGGERRMGADGEYSRRRRRMFQWILLAIRSAASILASRIWVSCRQGR